MRLDLFLKSSRLCLRRTVAQQLCDAGMISVNGKPAKSSTPVQLGNELSIRRRDGVLRVRIVALPKNRQTSRSEASGLYEILGEEKLEPLDL
jgi:ribosomal 50S subunit-recycling heat shock protein